MIQRNNRTPKPPPAPRARFMGFLKTIQTIWGQQQQLVKAYMQMVIIAYFSWGKKCSKKSWVICILMNMSTDCNTVILVQLDLNDFDLAGIWKIPFSGFNSLSLCTKICKCAILLFFQFYFTASLYIFYFILLSKYYYLANLTRIHIEF